MFASLLTCALLATAAFAIPSPEARLAARIARRQERSHLSSPLQRVPGLTSDVIKTNVTQLTETSSNWAGAVFESPSGTFKAVTGTFVVPTPKVPSGGSSSTSFSASAWVGIDGDTCGTAILQTGVDFNVRGSSVSFDAWFEWFPAFASDFSGIPIKAGDTIKLTVTATTTKSGSAVIENVTTGKTVTKALTSTSALCQQNAEWIVEDFDEGNSQVPFANFGTVQFTNAVATTSSGTTGPGSAILINMVQNGKTLTSVSTSSTGVKVSHT